MHTYFCLFSRAHWGNRSDLLIAMLNVEEFLSPELRLAMCHVKEAIRIILHCLVVCRTIGGADSIDPKAVVSELFDVEYVRINESQHVQVPIHCDNATCDMSD